MRAAHRVTLLLVPALLALSSCGITATGVVEAGGPAGGIVATTPLYFLKNGAPVAVPVRTVRPGDAGTAVELLLAGPSLDQRQSGFTTEVPALPDFVQPAPTTTPGSPGGQVEPQAVRPTVSVDGDSLSIRLPYATRALHHLATQQLICTAAAAHRMAVSSTGPVTVALTDSGGGRVQGTDERCPTP
jgi:hypothetical protein